MHDGEQQQGESMQTNAGPGESDPRHHRQNNVGDKAHHKVTGQIKVGTVDPPMQAGQDRNRNTEEATSPARTTNSGVE